MPKARLATGSVRQRQAAICCPATAARQAPEQLLPPLPPFRLLPELPQKPECTLTAMERAAQAATQADGRASSRSGWRAWLPFWSCTRRGARPGSAAAGRAASPPGDSQPASQPGVKEAHGASADRVTVVCAPADCTELEPLPHAGGRPGNAAA